MTDPRPSRIDRRWAIALAGIACVAIGVGVSAWIFAPRGVVIGVDGGRMAISVVPPREPDILPGSVLEVGVLSDGFDRAALERRAEPEDPTWMPPEAYAGADLFSLDLPRMPLPTPAVPDAVAAPQNERSAAAVDPLGDGSRLFGFDRPAPDLSDERARRLAGLAEAERAAALPSDVPPKNYTQPAEYSSE